MSERQAAETINLGGVTALMDLNGWSGGLRTGIIAERPAPVQVNYKNWVASSGMPNLHYIVGDAVATPPEFQSDFTEGGAVSWSYACIPATNSLLYVGPSGMVKVMLNQEGCCDGPKHVLKA